MKQLAGRKCLRLSPAEAVRLGLISPAEAEKITAAAAASTRYRQVKGAGRDNLVPQRKLFDACAARWPGEVQWNYAVYAGRTSRPYHVDVAFPALQLGIEVDGFRFHALHVKAFQHDRVRGNRLLLKGWQLLHYFPGQIHKELPALLEEIENARAEKRATTSNQTNKERV